MTQQQEPLFRYVHQRYLADRLMALLLLPFAALVFLASGDGLSDKFVWPVTGIIFLAMLTGMLFFDPIRITTIDRAATEIHIELRSVLRNRTYCCTPGDRTRFDSMDATDSEGMGNWQVRFQSQEFGNIVIAEFRKQADAEALAQRGNHALAALQSKS